MKNLTKKEKRIIVDALECALDNYEKAKDALAPTPEKEDLTNYLESLDGLRRKIITEAFDIEVRSNNAIIRSRCPICLKSHKPGVPEWGFLNGIDGYRPLCEDCFKEYAPKLFKETTQKIDEFDLMEAEEKVKLGFPF